MRGLVRQIEYNPGDLGLNGVTFSAERSSTAFAGDGFNQARIIWEVTRVDATDIAFYLEELMPGGSNYGRGRFGDVDPATGIMTLRQLQYLVPSLATAANRRGYVDVPINGGNLCLGGIIGTAASTDTVVFKVRLGVV